MLLQPILIYPECTEFAVSNLAVHWFFNAFEEFSPDLVTADSSEGLFYKLKVPNTPFVFVSLSYSVNLLNLFDIFKKNKIPLFKKDRERGIYPIFIIGGVAAFLNPEPLTEIFDAVLLGEGECMENDIKKMMGLDTREQVFDFIDKLPYAMTGSKRDAVIVRAEEHGFFVHSNEKLHTLGNCFSNRKVVEMNRGCTSRCRFCAASYVYKTFRETNVEKLMSFAKETIDSGSGLALMGTSLASLSQFDEILEYCAEKHGSLSLSSLKVREINDRRIALLKECGAKTVTVAVESALPETRERILKKITDEDIFNAMMILHKYSMKSKLYFIAGLPGTTPDAEVEAIVGLLDTLNKKGILGETELSVASFSPKPLTPLSGERFMSKKEYKSFMTLLKKGAASVSGKIKVDYFSYKESELDYSLGTCGSFSECSDLIGEYLK